MMQVIHTFKVSKKISVIMNIRCDAWNSFNRCSVRINSSIVETCPPSAHFATFPIRVCTIPPVTSSDLQPPTLSVHDTSIVRFGGRDGIGGLGSWGKRFQTWRLRGSFTQLALLFVLCHYSWPDPEMPRQRASPENPSLKVCANYNHSPEG